MRFSRWVILIIGCLLMLAPGQRSLVAEGDTEAWSDGLGFGRSSTFLPVRSYLIAVPDMCPQIASVPERTKAMLNKTQGLRATVFGNGMRCSPLVTDSSDWSVSILLDRIGRGADWFEPNVDATTQRTKDHMVSKHGAFDLEHVNSEAGIRQNFIVHRKPSGEGPLRVELRTEGVLACAYSGADIFDFKDTTGNVCLRYSDLNVWDAHGDTLRASAILEEDLIVLLVEDVQAIYPITIDPLATTPVWSAESNAASAQMGSVVSSAGDVNGDGYSDVLIGSPGWTNGQTAEGRAQVFLGGPNGPAATAAWAFEPDQLNANMGSGTSLATAGDVNGDGYSDIIIAAPFYDNGQTNEGRVFVFHGSSTGLSATPDWTAESDQATAYFGWSVACAGDVNADGYSDVIIGAYFFDNGQTDEGRVFVYHGSATGLASTPAWTKESDQAGARFGYAVAGAGDVNGDGFSDVIIGAPYFDNGQSNEGRALVYHGSTTGLAAVAAWTVESDQALALMGYSVSTAGDTNNDGYADVLVGTPFYDGAYVNAGRVAVHLGSAGGPLVAAIWSSIGAAVDEGFGQTVACAGDVNGDGLSDVVFGSPTSGTGDEGQARVYLGSTTGPLSLDWIQTATGGDQLGASVASAGDVNGDGISDVIIGIPNYDNGQTNEGRVRVYLGRLLGLGATGWVGAAAPGYLYGRRVAAAGDVNGDGYGDVIVGAEEFSFGQALEGAAFAYGGSANGPSPGALVLQSDQVGWESGSSVACAGDVNGDGYSDVIIGAPRAFAGVGRAMIHHGSSTGLSTTPAFTYVGGAAQEWGTCVASAGDVNGDGYSDVLVGALNSFALLYGSATGVSVMGTVTIPGPAGGFFGASVATAGDVNGDGYSDVIVGAGGVSGFAGRVQVHHGGPAGLVVAPAWLVNGTQAGAWLGSSAISGPTAASAGDVNGDGYSDVVVSEHYFANGHAQEGRVHLYLGSSTGLSTTPAWLMEGNATQAWFGVAVGSAGDVNGDGYSDVIIGACEGTSAAGTGKVYVYHGGPAGLSATPDYLANGPVAGAEFGHSISSAGDVDGDGDSDVLIGIYGQNQAMQVNGNAQRGRRSNMRIYNTDLNTPISTANLPNIQFGMGLFSRPFLGRQRTKCVWETRIQGQPFSSTGGTITNSVGFTAQNVSFSAGALAGVELKQLVTKPGGGTGLTATKVRARVRYDPVTALTGQVFGPWRYMPGYLDGLGTHNNVPLPVELLRFEAQCVNGAVEISWATGSEENSSHFVVERSDDAEPWTEVVRIEAAGHSQQMLEYNLQDAAPPHAKTLYYRLKQVDLDGTTTVLPITRSTSCSSFRAPFPNPTDGSVHLDLGVAFDAAKRVDVIDAQGRTVLEVLPPGLGTALTVNLSGLPPGPYTVRILTAAGTIISADRIMKQ